MSKRGMEVQGGSDRYGGAGGQEAADDKPMQATAAQLARRKILQAKGKGTPRGSRAGSPAVASQGTGGANPFQSFQPPPTANSFNFSVPGSTPAPSFGQTAPQQDGGMSFGGQTNGTPSFGGFGNTQSNNAPSFGSTFGSNNAQAQTNGFDPSTSFNFGGQTQPDIVSTPNTSFSFGQTPSQSQEQPKQNGFNLSTRSMFGGLDGQQSQQPQTNGEQTSKPNPFAGFFSGQAQPNGDKTPATTGLLGSTPSSAATTKPGESIFSGLTAPSASTVRPGMFTQSQAPQDGERSQTQTPQSAFTFGAPPQANGQGQSQANGASSQEPKALFTFGQPPQQNGEATPKASHPFAGAFSQPKAAEAVKPAATNGEQTPKANTASNQFAGIFGQSTQPQVKTAKKAEATTGADLFGGMGQQKKPETPFGDSQSQTAQTLSQSLFGSVAAPQSNGAPTFNFGASQQEDTSMLTPGNTPHKLSISAAEPQQPSAQQAAEPETPANPNAGKSMFERISRDPPATTSNSRFSFGQTGGSRDAQAEETPNPNAGKSLFERITPRDPEPPTTAPKPSTAPLFSITAPTPAAPERLTTQLQRPAVFAGSTTTSTVAPARQKVKQLNEGLLSHLKSEDPSKDWSSTFHFYIDQAAKLMGRDAVKAPTAPAQGPPALPPASSGGPSERKTFTGSSAKPSAPSGGFGSQPGTVHAMPLAPRGYSSRAPQPTTPLPSATNIFSQAFNPSATAPANRKRSAEDELTKGTASAEPPATEKRNKPNGSAQYPKLPDTASNTAKLFASTLDKPVQKPASTGPPSFGPSNDLMAKIREQKAAREAAQQADHAEEATAPASAFKPATTFQFGAPRTSSPGSEPLEEIPQAPTFGQKSNPAAEVHSTISQTPVFTFKPSTTFKFGAPAADAPAAEKSAESPHTPSFGFTPVTATEKPTQTPKVPSFRFKPAAAPAGGSSFLSAFGKSAEASLEDAKRKRMDEDYDSDDEDKASWEARDNAEQEAKRLRIEEAAKSGPVFKFPTAATGEGSKAPFAFKFPATEKPAEKPAEEAATQPAKDTPDPPNPSAGKSLFDRITPANKAPSTPSMFSAQTPGQGITTSNFFSQMKTGATPSFKFGAPTPDKGADADKAQPEKDQGTGDNTWRPSTPIKFGAPTGTQSTTPAAPPPTNPFSGLFGPGASAGNSGKLAPPTVGFTFGAPKGVSTDVSRATTPGVTTDGEASNAGDGAEGAEGEPSDQPSEKQVEDMTALLAEEREAEDILFEVPLAKTMKRDNKDTEGGTISGWVERGKGPLYILKNKSSRKTRLLMKIPPLGRPAMNFSPLKNFPYSCPAGKKTMSATFIDHFNEIEAKAGKPSAWTIQVKDPKDAQEIARILNEEKS